MDITILYIALAAFGGGILAAGLGYFESPESFNPKKFGASIIRALIAGLVFAVGYSVTGAGISVLDILIAVVGGAGIDVLGNRAAGVVLTKRS